MPIHRQERRVCFPAHGAQSRGSRYIVGMSVAGILPSLTHCVRHSSTTIRASSTPNHSASSFMLTVNC
jgi:hypothetical protein